jgi:hypothetical protein
MTVNNLKKLLIGKIAETSDEEILKVVYRLLDNYNQVHQLSPEETFIVKEAQAEYKRGESISDEDLQKEIDEWLKD